MDGFLQSLKTVGHFSYEGYVGQVTQDETFYHNYDVTFTALPFFVDQKVIDACSNFLTGPAFARTMISLAKLDKGNNNFSLLHTKLYYNLPALEGKSYIEHSPIRIQGIETSIVRDILQAIVNKDEYVIGLLCCHIRDKATEFKNLSFKSFAPHIMTGSCSSMIRPLLEGFTHIIGWSLADLSLESASNRNNVKNFEFLTVLVLYGTNMYNYNKTVNDKNRKEHELVQKALTQHKDGVSQILNQHVIKDITSSIMKYTEPDTRILVKFALVYSLMNNEPNVDDINNLLNARVSLWYKNMVLRWANRLCLTQANITLRYQPLKNVSATKDRESYDKTWWRPEFYDVEYESHHSVKKCTNYDLFKLANKDIKQNLTKTPDWLEKYNLTHDLDLKLDTSNNRCEKLRIEYVLQDGADPNLFHVKMVCE